ncbi:hypothetical protein GCM10028807_55310 [Spirosoma daeguense]
MGKKFFFSILNLKSKSMLQYTSPVLPTELGKVPATPVEEIYSHPVNKLIERVSAEPPPQYIFRGVVHPSVGVFYGPAKSGKTVLAENMLMHIASGTTEFLNQPLFIPHRKVLVVGMEEFYRNRTIRNMKQLDYLTDTLDLDPLWDRNFHVVDETFPRFLHGEAHWDLLKKEIDRLEPSVVVLDSLTRLSTDPIEESTVAQKLMSRLRDLAYSREITLIIIHHAHKMDDRPLSMSNMAGSRVIAQELDFMLGVNRISNGTRYLKDIAYRYASEDSSKVMTFTINDSQIIVPGEFRTERELLKEVESRDFNENDALVLAYFTEFTHQDGSVLVSAAKLIEQFVTTKVMSRPTLYACLRRLEEGKIITKVAKGEYTLLPLS